MVRALDLLARVRANDCGASAATSARPFIVGDEPLGRVLPSAAAALASFAAFDVDAAAVRLRDEPSWRADGVDGERLVAARSASVASVLEQLRCSGSVPCLAGWRGELLGVRPTFHSAPRLLVERAAGPLFGIYSYGVFANGYVRGADGHPSHIWLGRRSMSKQTWPGLLDCIAAGGVAAGEVPMAAMIKECAEEAAIPSTHAAGLVPVGGVSYTGLSECEWGLKQDFLYCFDLALEPEFEPRAADGEMDAFELHEVGEVLSMLADTSQPIFKPNVGVVLCDFAVRHGLVHPDDDGYLELVCALRSVARHQ